MERTDWRVREVTGGAEGRVDCGNEKERAYTRESVQGGWETRWDKERNSEKKELEDSKV